MPGDPNGTQAQGHAVLDNGVPGGPGIVTQIVVDNPGSGYYEAPGVKVLNGTRFDPIVCGGAAAEQGPTRRDDAVERSGQARA